MLPLATVADGVRFQYHTTLQLKPLQRYRNLHYHANVCNHHEDNAIRAQWWTLIKISRALVHFSDSSHNASDIHLWIPIHWDWNQISLELRQLDFALSEAVPQSEFGGPIFCPFTWFSCCSFVSVSVLGYSNPVLRCSIAASFKLRNLRALDVYFDRA